MTNITMSEDHFIGPLANRIGKWADDLLGGYLLDHPEAPTARKQVHDPLGKIIELEPWEVYVLNSPVVQRLRYVRQLGVGHYLFPTAGYSRFEHSLGAMQTATMMFDAVVHARDDLGGASGPALTPAEYQQQRGVVRLAALLHDIGHCLFSHVSEKFYERHPEVKQAQQFFRDRFEQGSISASETVALLIIQSQPFLKMLQAARVQRIGLGEQEIVSELCLCIAGSVNRKIPNSYLAEIINGSVDCDKLDYLVRDSHMAGVPIQLDVARLLSKLRAAQREIDDGPHAGEKTWALAIVPSGARALDELQVARIFLYDKFYYHHKVMAAEELIRKGFERLASFDPTFRDPAFLLTFGDDDFLSLTPKRVESTFPGAETNQLVVEGCKFLTRARYRDLPKRVFAFATRFLPDQLPLVARFETNGKSALFAEDIRKEEFRQFVRRLDTPTGLDLFIQGIKGFAANLNANTEIYVAVQSAKRAAGSMYLPVVLTDGKVDDKPGYLFRNAEWTEAYALNKATSYVFADRPSIEAHLAVERVFAERRLIFAPSAWVAAKISETALSNRRKTFGPDWIESRLQPNYLKTYGAKKLIEELQRKFGSFLSSVDEGFGLDLVETWASQFPDADLQDSALRLLKHTTYVGASDLVKSFEQFADGDASLRTAIWIPFRPKGGGGTSADSLLVDLKDSTLRMTSIASVSPQEIRDAGSVVFFDDNLNSGVQCSCLLSSWFAANEDCENPGDKDPDGPLSQELQQALRDVPVSFALYAKHPTGDARLRALAPRLGLQLRDVMGAIDSGIARYTLEGFDTESAASKARFLDFLQRKGEALLRPNIEKKAGWTEDRVVKSALGYSSIHLTIVFRHSISTSTPVVLWKMSTDFEDQWIPIFPKKREALRKILRAGGDEMMREPVEEYGGV